MVNFKTWVWRDDSSAWKIHSFSGQIATESTLLSLKSLNKSPTGFLSLKNLITIIYFRIISRIKKHPFILGTVTCIVRGIPEVSLFIYKAHCSCKKSQSSYSRQKKKKRYSLRMKVNIYDSDQRAQKKGRTIIICILAPDERCFWITLFKNMISLSFIVTSSSFLRGKKFFVLKMGK